MTHNTFHCVVGGVPRPVEVLVEPVHRRVEVGERVLLCIVVSQEVIIRRREDTMVTSSVPCQSAGRSLVRLPRARDCEGRIDVLVSSPLSRPAALCVRSIKRGDDRWRQLANGHRVFRRSGTNTTRSRSPLRDFHVEPRVQRALPDNFKLCTSVERHRGPVTVSAFSVSSMLYSHMGSK